MLGLPYGHGGVEHLVHPLGTAPDPLARLDGERQAVDGLEGGERHQDHDGEPHPVQAPGGDRLNPDECGGHHGQSAGQRGEAAAERGGGSGPRRDPRERRVGVLRVPGTAAERARDRQLARSGEQIGHAGGQMAARGRQLALGPARACAADHRHGHSGDQQSDREHRPGLGQQPDGESGTGHRDHHGHGDGSAHRSQ